MGSPAFWGKLVNFTASLRKPALIAFGDFSPNDNLNFIADMPGVASSFTPTTTPPDGTRTTFQFAGLPAYIVWNGVIQFQNVGYTITGPVSGVYTVTFIDYLGNVLTPGSSDTLRSAGVTTLASPNSTALTQTAIPFAPDLVINVSLAQVITVVVTGNISSTELTYPFSAVPTGTWLYIRFTMNSRGGWTVVLPTNLSIDSGFAIDPTPFRTTVLPIQYDGVGWVFFNTPFSVTGL